MNAKEVSYVGEVWKDIKNYEDEYQVSNLGRVRNKKTKKILKLKKEKNGYLRVGLRKNGKQKWYLVHRLVWEAFNGKIPEGMEINHISEDKTDSRLCNLNLLNHKANICWGTCIERRAKSKSKSVIQKSLQGEIIKIWASLIEIQRALGYRHECISSCCRGKRKTAYKYIWQYER